MKTSEKKYKEFKKKIEEAKKEAKAIFHTAFTEMAKEVFENNPELTAFSWTQYTPYFNDGNPCYFSAHTDYPELTILKDGKEEEYDGNYDGVPERFSKIERAVKTFLNTFDPEDLETSFGEGKVIVLKNGTIDTDDYDHE